jgi:IS4 transposase
MHDVNLLYVLPIEPGAFYIMDRGYTDFERLNRFTEELAFYVIRAKSNFRFDRRYSNDVDKSSGLQFDQTVVLGDPVKYHKYPTPIRRIGFVDPLTKKRLVFLTNNFALPALTITQLYKSRWQVELFFKWIKQHLRIKAFYGTSPNAVKTQIWIAISVYILVAIVKKKLALSHSLYTILQILSVSLFEKSPILEVFSDDSYISEESESQNQLSLLRF